MIKIEDFKYSEDINLSQLKNICVKTDSLALKKTFEYLRILFYFTKPEKIIAKIIPNVAYIVATIAKKHIRIVDLGVVKVYQHKGIGRLLINHIIEQAKCLNVDKITLRTSSEETAFMFYEKLGFKATGMIKEDIEMELKL